MAKLYLSILLSLLCFIDIQAQKLNVESFVTKTNDITARTQPRQDINGNDCALVKVRLAAGNASFSGNVIGNVAYDKSEYFVYMPHGSRRLTIKLEGYLPLDVNFSEYGINSLEGKTVYVLTLSGVTGTQQLEAPKTKTGWIILDSEPSGASVYIKDEFVGNTPLSNYKQAYGTYQYRLESPNYHSATGKIELNSGRYEQKVVLKPAFGSISVNSSIAGAKILLDGRQTGKQTPATLTEIPSGTHTITLQMDKYAPRQQEVMVEDGQTANIFMALDARFARITINSLDGAEIYSNGKLLGKGRISEDMMEGYYDLEARLDHHKSVTKQIQVVAGLPQDVLLKPIPKYGSIDIVSTPHNATVKINGKEVGKTPLSIDNLLEGEYKVDVSLDGYTNESRVVSILENETAAVETSLKKEMQPASYTGSINEGNFEIFTVNDVSFKMIRIEGGTFTMGATEEQGKKTDNDEYPTHRVTLSTYHIGETEVTQALWEAVMGSNPSYFNGKNHPVEQVSWNDCQEFVARLSSLTGRKFRLPTEAEWEFAARGGNRSKGYIYSGSNTENDVSWIGSNSQSGTHEVKTKLANELGLYDMSGNVSEWCQDRYGEYNSSDQTNPEGPSSGNYRVLRNSGWSSASGGSHVSERSWHTTDDSFRNRGLRLAL